MEKMNKKFQDLLNMIEPDNRSGKKETKEFEQLIAVL